MSLEADTSRPELVRALSRWDLAAVGVNQVIGSGIFVLPATVAALVGQGASIWPWVAAGVANFLIALCFSEAGSQFRSAGGPYQYATAAFGSFAGFEVGWMMWLTRVASQAALANALALYFGFFWAGATEGVGRRLVVTGMIVLLAVINFLGVRYGSWAVNLFTVAKLGPLALFVALGLGFVEWDRIGGLGDAPLADFGQAVLLLMFAFGGYELITIPASEARSPRRDAPVALMLTIGLVCAFYFLIQLVAVGTLPNLGATDTPLADAARLFLGAAAGGAIAIGGLVSIAGSNSGSMLAGPRITYALGTRSQLPAFFAHVHPKFRTPDLSILVYAGVALVLALSGTFEQLAAVSAVARIVFYMTTCAAVPVLRRQSDQDQRGFRLAGGPLIPAVALIVCAAILAGATYQQLGAGVIALGVGALLYGLQQVGGGRQES